MQQAGRIFGPDNFFWNQIKSHPNYDSFWQDRAIVPHLKNIKANVLTVGGLFDAEDLYGPLNTYRHIEDQNPDAFNMLVMGPWSHGDWSFKYQYAKVGKIAFGKNVSNFYQREIEAPFFRHFLKEHGDSPKYVAIIYDTGKLQWFGFESWPPAKAEQRRLYLSGDRQLNWNALTNVKALRIRRSMNFLATPMTRFPIGNGRTFACNSLLGATCRTINVSLLTDLTC